MKSGNHQKSSIWFGFHPFHMSSGFHALPHARYPKIPGQKTQKPEKNKTILKSMPGTQQIFDFFIITYSYMVNHGQLIKKIISLGEITKLPSTFHHFEACLCSCNCLGQGIPGGLHDHLQLPGPGSSTGEKIPMIYRVWMHHPNGGDRLWDFWTINSIISLAVTKECTLCDATVH